MVKDLLNSNFYPCFYILMSNKTEILYTIVFHSIKNLLTQYYIYDLQIETITTDIENALINGLNNTFTNFKRLGCWFHLKCDLIREAKSLCNKKNKNVDINDTFKIISVLSILPLKYNGNIEYVKEIVDSLSTKYPYYYNYLNNYFLEYKLKYFIDGSLDYSKFPMDIRTNSSLEKYNKLIKETLGKNRFCDWINFLNFIKTEIKRINLQFSQNANINVLYATKKTKFGINKYNNTFITSNNINNYFCNLYLFQNLFYYYIYYY